ncbi:hypothetical protein Ocin01_09920 [Orchesella cincta]|uniref:Uncharacterized protein n=1 Tax=Orchesella cincta TaxID=48709 RepID=A0A1D2MV24_ORCCI|nr:hypothetical protein Ocin01_09920 [Orchesella cincta]
MRLFHPKNLYKSIYGCTKGAGRIKMKRTHSFCKAIYASILQFSRSISFKSRHVLPFAVKMEPTDNQPAGAELISLVLHYLNAEELRAARLWNTAVNQIITNDPKLLWAKNVIQIQIDALQTNAKLEWVRLRLLRLITLYNCPNFHIVKTSLLSSEALDFFQSSVRYQMKYLKITKCQMSTEVLLHILACTAKHLGHLEIRDFSQFVQSSGNLFPKERRGPNLSNLKTIILDNNAFSDDTQISSEGDDQVSLSFVKKVLEKSINLESIGLLGWNATSCHHYVKVLAALPPGNLDNVQTFSLSCNVDIALNIKSQYDFLRELQWIRLPNLTRLTIDCNLPLELATGLTGSMIEDFTKSLAILLEGATETLEMLELINCPVTNEVLRIGMNSFPNLSKVDTSGSMITKLDPNGNATPRYKIPLQRKPGKSPVKSQIRYAARLEETDGGTPESTRYEVYEILCGIILAAMLIHFGATSVFRPHFATMMEIVIS